jgi:hydrogenase-4 membrane subunit HyfE
MMDPLAHVAAAFITARKPLLLQISARINAAAAVIIQ